MAGEHSRVQAWGSARAAFKCHLLVGGLLWLSISHLVIRVFLSTSVASSGNWRAVIWIQGTGIKVTNLCLKKNYLKGCKANVYCSSLNRRKKEWLRTTGKSKIWSRAGCFWSGIWAPTIFPLPGMLFWFLGERIWLASLGFMPVLCQRQQVSFDQQPQKNLMNKEEAISQRKEKTIKLEVSTRLDS